MPNIPMSSPPMSEDDLRAALHDSAPARGDALPLDHIIRRGRRRRLAAQSAASVAALGVVGAVTVVAISAPGGSAGGSADGAAGGAAGAAAGGAVGAAASSPFATASTPEPTRSPDTMTAAATATALVSAPAPTVSAESTTVDPSISPTSVALPDAVPLAATITAVTVDGGVAALWVVPATDSVPAQLPLATVDSAGKVLALVYGVLPPSKDGAGWWSGQLGGDSAASAVVYGFVPRDVTSLTLVGVDGSRTTVSTFAVQGLHGRAFVVVNAPQPAEIRYTPTGGAPVTVPAAVGGSVG